MSASIYGNVGGVARKAKELYGNVGGVTRKLKSAHANVGGVTRKIFSGGYYCKKGTANYKCLEGDEYLYSGHSSFAKDGSGRFSASNRSDNSLVVDFLFNIEFYDSFDIGKDETIFEISPTIIHGHLYEMLGISIYDTTSDASISYETILGSSRKNNYLIKAEVSRNNIQKTCIRYSVSLNATSSENADIEYAWSSGNLKLFGNQINGFDNIV